MPDLHQHFTRSFEATGTAFRSATPTAPSFTSAFGRAVACLAILATAGSCASAPKAATTLVAPSWPAPPLPPRITFVQVYADQQSMGPTKRGAAEAFLAYLSGKQPPSNHLYQPMDIDVTDDGQRVYIADFGQGTVFLVDFVAKTLAPLPRDFERPFGLGIDTDANVYVSEQEGRRITVLSPAFKTLRVITHESLVRPSGLAIDRARGLVYVADPSRGDSTDHSVKVFDLSGTLVRTLGAGRGNCDGCLLFPTFVAVDSKGQVYVSNTLNARIDVFDAEGHYVRRVGERGNAYGMFDKPKGVAVDSFDNVYVVDSGWANVQIFNQAGDPLLFFGGRGTNPGLLNNPTGIGIDRQNRIYVADFLNYRVASYQLVNTKAGDAERPPKDQATAPGPRVP